MCFPYTVELKVESDLAEALLKDIFHNAKESFKDTEGPIHKASISIEDQFVAAMKKHIEEKHKDEKIK